MEGYKCSATQGLVLTGLVSRQLLLELIEKYNGTRFDHLNLKQLIWNHGPRAGFPDIDTGQGAC